ncbi:AlpA family transcriptional regulator [Rhodoferax sp. TS-BS-61-7]|uniref:AlpA family transcriptional regulator n=1 Tax=Rhodoferax sp. TS-BS-61-7 TaxID=2094194 RepID=UPI000CF71E62|nr:AlpA family transcriptional regulator [Rhodoferax sp. TS-BS-61-7]PQA78927.1 transcriptional regulator [Rhodoferax sp. TS-BS-61-7]
MSPNGQPQTAQTTASASNHPSENPIFPVPAKPGKLLRLTHVEARTALKKSSIYAGVKSRTFPAPVRLGARAVAWREEEIDRWIVERVKVGASA